ncbi:MAG: hypothetical protein ACLUEQ_04785, partial [Cloacibacillus evryensis]
AVIFPPSILRVAPSPKTRKQKYPSDVILTPSFTVNVDLMVFLPSIDLEISPMTFNEEAVLEPAAFVLNNIPPDAGTVFFNIRFPAFVPSPIKIVTKFFQSPSTVEIVCPFKSRVTFLTVVIFSDIVISSVNSYVPSALNASFNCSKFATSAARCSRREYHSQRRR